MQPDENETKFIKSLEIIDVLLLSSKHDVYSLHNDKELSLNFEKKGDLNLIIKNDMIIFEVVAIVELIDESNNELLLSSEAKFASIYAYDKKVLGLNENEISGLADTFFRYSAITHILSFAREYFSAIIVKSGYPRVILPLIKSALDEEAEEEASKTLNTKSSEKVK